MSIARYLSGQLL